MKKLSISTRITIWYTVFLIIICAVLMAVLLQFYEQKERNTAERKLIHIVEDVSDSIADAGREFPLDKHVKYYIRDTYISVYDKEGSLITGRRPHGFDEFPVLVPESTTELRDLSGQEWYIYDTTVHMRDSDDLFIRGMMNNEGHDKTDRFFMNFLLYSIPVLLLLAAAGGWIISKRALDPLRELIRVSDEIKADGDLSKRIPVPESRDEVRELAESFNGMFDRIENLIDREKQFSSDVSHELRTPLAVIRSQSEYAMEDPGYAPEAAAVINRESRRMSGLVSNLLLLARSDSGRLQPEISPVDLGDLLAETAELSRVKAAESDISIECIHEADGAETSRPVIVESDPDLLIRIILNLLDNAVKYGKSPGGRIIVRLTTDGDTAVCTVADDGEGIAREERDMIWQRFYRSDKARSGEDSSGLGLAMAKSLTTEIGGSLRYVDEEERSEKDLRGAMFELKLPLAVKA